ncbi:MAG TPA: isochorismatase family protein [Rhizobiaceae bacterium]|nr:isochorismatase family protein [Rhizobiaceae bacterium]
MSAAGPKGDLDANYARAGYHARQKWGSRPAIVLIDFANAYFDPASPLYGGEGCRTALDNAIKLAPAARAAGVPVIFTEVKYQAGGADGGAFFAKVPALSCFEAGKDTQRLAEGLAVGPMDALVTKQYPSAFFGTSLDAMLRWMKVDTLMLAGVTTSGCVRATCIDSISYGFVTLVISDAVGDRAPEPHAANLYDMSAKYADLLSTVEAIEYMQAVQQTETGRTQS